VVLHDHPTTYGQSLRRMERVGRAARRLHELHPGLVHPGVGRPGAARAWTAATLARALVPRRPADGLPRPVRDLRWRIMHLDAYYRGYRSGDPVR
jgi:hypothetical protein